MEKAAADAAVSWAIEHLPHIAQEAAEARKQLKRKRNAEVKKKTRANKKAQEIQDGIRDADGIERVANLIFLYSLTDSVAVGKLIKVVTLPNVQTTMTRECSRR
jgi:transcription elongation GreA/GreB family factor